MGVCGFPSQSNNQLSLGNGTPSQILPIGLSSTRQAKEHERIIKAKTLCIPRSGLFIVGVYNHRNGRKHRECEKKRCFLHALQWEKDDCVGRLMSVLCGPCFERLWYESKVWQETQKMLMQGDYLKRWIHSQTGESSAKICGFLIALFCFCSVLLLLLSLPGWMNHRTKENRERKTGNCRNRPELLFISPTMLPSNPKPLFHSMNKRKNHSWMSYEWSDY
jgi:hypothetical protein